MKYFLVFSLFYLLVLIFFPFTSCSSIRGDIVCSLVDLRHSFAFSIFSPFYIFLSLDSDLFRTLILLVINLFRFLAVPLLTTTYYFKAKNSKISGIKLYLQVLGVFIVLVSISALLHFFGARYFLFWGAIFD